MNAYDCTRARHRAVNERLAPDAPYCVVCAQHANTRHDVGVLLHQLRLLLSRPVVWVVFVLPVVMLTVLIVQLVRGDLP